MHSCSDNGYCVDTQGGHNCICNTGYTGDGVVCTDVNECKDDENNCHEDADCYNQPVGYDCVCHTGYEGPSLNHFHHMNVGKIIQDPLKIERFSLRSLQIMACSDD